MIIKVKNNVILSVSEYLQTIKVKGKAIRGKQKLLQKLVEKSQDFLSSTEEIKEEFKEKEEQQEQFEILLKEDAIIDLTEYPSHIIELYKIVDDYPEDVGKNESVHTILADILEKSVKNENGDDE